MNIAVLGAGLIGRTIAADLAASGQIVTAIDKSADNLRLLPKDYKGETKAFDLSKSMPKKTGAATTHRAKAKELDGSNRSKLSAVNTAERAALRKLLDPFDMVVGALPGFMAFPIIRDVLAAGKPTVDISFYPEDPFDLDGLAKEKGVPSITDIGLAPGIPNIVAGRLQEEWAELSSFTFYVGGLPETRRQPFEYAAVFSPIDVIAEYTRPARMKIDGEVVTRVALSERELMDFPGVGTLEAFNTDGIRTLLRTLQCPNIKEKTLRYPGHARLMEVFRESGFFDETPLEVGGATVRPLDVTARLLFPRWKLPPGEGDIAVLKVEAEGKTKDGKASRREWLMVDRHDATKGVTAMARTTGYTCAAAARAVAKGVYTRPGVSPPEYLGRDKAAHDFVLADLAERGVALREIL